MALQWTLTIPTLNRISFLIETIRCALQQTRPPAEIVVVDASVNWEQHYALARSEFGSAWDRVRLVYRGAEVRSLTCQRNQALRLATSEIVFSLDDDIYLYPDAAEIIMGVYEADAALEVAMVTGLFASRPAASMTSAELRRDPRFVAIPVRSWIEGQLSLDSHFVPYAEPVATGPVPVAISHLHVRPSGLINGGRTTFRRSLGIQCGWSELLRYYATHEDSDFSYRMSRLGRLVVAPDARMFHADGNDKKVGAFRTNTIRVRNLLALHVIHSPNRLRSALRCAAAFAKFFALYLFIDAGRRRYTLPTARAYAYGLAQIPVFLFGRFADFRNWYLQVQERMYADRYRD